MLSQTYKAGGGKTIYHLNQHQPTTKAPKLMSVLGGLWIAFSICAKQQLPLGPLVSAQGPKPREGCQQCSSQHPETTLGAA